MGFRTEAFIKSLQPIEEIHPQTYSKDSFQYFLGLNDGQQKEIINTHQNKVEAVLFQAKNSLENVLNYLEKNVEWGEKWIEKMKNNPLTIIAMSNMQLETGKMKTTVIWGRDQFKNFDQKSGTEKIKAIQEVRNELEKIDWKDRNRGK